MDYSRGCVWEGIQHVSLPDKVKNYWELKFYSLIYIYLYLYLYILFLPLISSCFLPFCLFLSSFLLPNHLLRSPLSSAFLPFFCPLFKAPLPNPKLTYPCYSYFIFLPFLQPYFFLEQLLVF